MMNGLCESLIRKMDDNKAKSFLERFNFEVNEKDIEVIEKIGWHLAYDRYLCKLYGIDYVNICQHMNKVKLASYYEYAKTINLFEVTRKHRKNIVIIEELNGNRKAVVKSA